MLATPALACGQRALAWAPAAPLGVRGPPALAPEYGISSEGEAEAEEAAAEAAKAGVPPPPLDTSSSFLRAPLERSAKELDALLSRQHPSWKERCGLTMVVATDGTTEWVL